MCFSFSFLVKIAGCYRQKSMELTSFIVSVDLLSEWLKTNIYLVASFQSCILFLNMASELWPLTFQLKADFIQLLREQTDLDRHSRWSETKKKIDSDPRYKAVESSSRREDWFRDYIKNLEDVRRLCKLSDILLCPHWGRLHDFSMFHHFRIFQ